MDSTVWSAYDYLAQVDTWQLGLLFWKFWTPNLYLYIYDSNARSDVGRYVASRRLFIVPTINI